MAASERFGVLWDVDGTLVDTAELHFQAWRRVAAEIGAPFTRDDFAATFGWRNPEIIPKLFGPRTEADVDELGQRKEDYYRVEAANGLDLLPGVAELVRDLDAAGFGQAVGSSAPRANIELILDMCGLRSLLAHVVAMEDTTRGKPDPQVFLMAAKKIEVDPRRCVVFEDAPAGIRAAKAGGMKAVGITFVGHHSADKLRAEGADLVVPSLVGVHVQTVRRLIADS
jgi:beta-phosphoglucomutase